jgi:hypothetical protein
MAGEQAERRARATRARERLVDALDAALGDRLRVPAGERPDPYRDGVVVNAFGLTERCARRAAHPADDFVETVATARRRIGLAALRRLGDDASAADDLATAVQEVIEERTDLARGLCDWLEQLDRPGRAAVAAGAITWGTATARLVRSGAAVRWSDASSSSAWNVPERPIRLTATHEALVGGVVSGERLLLVAEGAGGPTERLRAAYLALVRSLGTQHATVRITLAAPSRGATARVEVDDALLDLAVDRVVEHVAMRADPPSAPPAPGRWCRHCHLLDLCDEGRARSEG